jgi:Flp pilus assembly protein TadB
MAQTKRKRRTKHRGTPAGTIQARGRTGRPLTAEEKKKQARMDARERRLNTPPSWRSAIIRAAFIAGGLFLLFALTGKGKNHVAGALLVSVVAMVVYVPGGYYIELFMYRRRQRNKAQGQRK